MGPHRFRCRHRPSVQHDAVESFEVDVLGHGEQALEGARRERVERAGERPRLATDLRVAGDPSHDDTLRKEVEDRMLAVLLGRTFFVLDHDICHPRELNWLTRTALGFSPGLLDLAEKLGMDRVHEICSAYAARNPGFTLSPSIEKKTMPAFPRNLDVEITDGIGVVTVKRPEVMKGRILFDPDATAGEVGRKEK